MKLISLFFLLIPIFNLAQIPTLLKDINPNDYDVGFFYNNQSEIELANDRFYFSGINDSQDYSKHQVYVSDGTSNGTFMVFEPEEGSVNPKKFTQVGDLVFFVGDAPFMSEELWVTDGTEAGTHLVKDINPDSFSRPFGLMDYNGKLYFWANDGVHGSELWTSDGTETGTYLVKDINTISGQGSAVESDFDQHPPVIYNDLMYFNARDASSDYSLWVSDGTTEGTVLFYDFLGVSELTVYDGKLYFSSNGIQGQNNTSGLWVTDGTVSGTSLVQYFNGGVQDLFFSNGKLFFYGSFTELWVTDGTTSGTQMVKDINPAGQSYWYPQNRPGLAPTMAELNGKLYFTAVHNNYGAELWVTDGTEAGTQMVMDIDEDNNVGPTSNYSGPYNLTVMNNKLYFTTSNNAYGHQLWVTQGTAETTQIIIPQNPKVDALRYTDKLVVLNNRLYFPAYYNDTDYPSIYFLGENMELNEVSNASNLLIYPNPVKDLLYFSESMSRIEIYSLTGELMMKFDNQKEINMGNLKKGIYLVKAQNQNGITKTSKIMKN